MATWSEILEMLELYEGQRTSSGCRTTFSASSFP